MEQIARSLLWVYGISIALVWGMLIIDIRSLSRRERLDIRASELMVLFIVNTILAPLVVLVVSGDWFYLFSVWFNKRYQRISKLNKDDTE